MVIGAETQDVALYVRPVMGRSQRSDMGPLDVRPGRRLDELTADLTPVLVPSLDLPHDPCHAHDALGYLLCPWRRPGWQKFGWSWRLRSIDENASKFVPADVEARAAALSPRVSSPRTIRRNGTRVSGEYSGSPPAPLITRTGRPSTPISAKALVLPSEMLICDLSPARGVPASLARVDDQIAEVLVILVAPAYDDRVRALLGRPRDPCL